MHLDFGNLLQKSISSHREERVRHQRFKRVHEAVLPKTLLGRKPREDFNQAAVRIVEEAAKKH